MHKLFTDGGSRGNPGDAAYGLVLFDEKAELVQVDAGYLGITTNNVAEYKGLLNGLKLAEKLKIKSLEIFMDSELIVKQIKGEYKVRDENLKKIYEEVQKHLNLLEEYNINHVKRKFNSHADRMVNIVLDSRSDI